MVETQSEQLEQKYLSDYGCDFKIRYTDQQLIQFLKQANEKQDWNAVLTFQRALINRDPTHSSSHITMSNAYEALGCFQEAIYELELAMRCNDNRDSSSISYNDRFKNLIKHKPRHCVARTADPEILMQLCASAKYDPYQYIDQIIDFERANAEMVLSRSELDDFEASLPSVFEGYEELRVISDPVKIRQKRDSLGNNFLKDIVTDTVKQIQNIDLNTLTGRVGENEFNLIKNQRDKFNFDLLSDECPQFVVAVANILFQAKQYNTAKNLLTIEGTSKWPNNFAVADMLCQIVSLDGNFRFQLSLLTQSDGGLRFPEKKEATKRILFAYNQTKQYQKVVDLMESFDSENDIWEMPEIVRNYVIALNCLRSSNRVVEQFIDEDKLSLPCVVEPQLLGNIGLALNSVGKPEVAYSIMKEHLNNKRFFNDCVFSSVISTSLGLLNRPNEAIPILMSDAGMYFFPSSFIAMKTLGYALVNAGRLREADFLLNWVRSRSAFNEASFFGVCNAFNRKMSNRFR